MPRIVCGWCGGLTATAPCIACGRDPRLPWTQRATEPPEDPETEGRPALDAASIRERYAAAKAQIKASGHEPTVEALAEVLDRSPRTVRGWRQRFGLE